MKLTTLAIAIIVLTSCKVMATVVPDPTPKPEPEPPVVVVPESPKVTDGDSEYDTYSRIYYSVCTCDKMKVGWGFESLELRTNKARSQCEAVRIRKSCPEKWK